MTDGGCPCPLEECQTHAHNRVVCGHASAQVHKHAVTASAPHDDVKGPPSFWLIRCSPALGRSGGSKMGTLQDLHIGGMVSSEKSPSPPLSMESCAGTQAHLPPSRRPDPPAVARRAAVCWLRRMS